MGVCEGVGATSTAVALAAVLADPGHPASAGFMPRAESDPFTPAGGTRPAGIPIVPGGVVVVDAATDPAARRLMEESGGALGHAAALVELRRFDVRGCRAGAARPGHAVGAVPTGDRDARSATSVGASGFVPAPGTGTPGVVGTDYASATGVLARRYAWMITDADPAVARADPAGILATADDLVLVTSVGTAGAMAAETVLTDLGRQGAQDLADRCVLVLTGVRDAGRPVARSDVRTYFEERCGAVVRLPHTPASGWPWSRRGLRELAELLMPVTADTA